MPIFFKRIDDVKSFIATTTPPPPPPPPVHCFDNGYMGKQLVAWKEYCAGFWFKELLESMDRCTGCRNITEILLKTASNTKQSIFLRVIKTRDCLGRVRRPFNHSSESRAPPWWRSDECVGLMTWLRRLFSPAYFRLSPLQKHMRKVVGGFGKKSGISTNVRKPGNTYASSTAMIMTLAVKVALNPSTTNQNQEDCRGSRSVTFYQSHYSPLF